MIPKQPRDKRRKKPKQKEPKRVLQLTCKGSDRAVHVLQTKESLHGDRVRDIENRDEGLGRKNDRLEALQGNAADPFPRHREVPMFGPGNFPKSFKASSNFWR